ncbi:hypothetical protein D9M71_815760 [compost metagenome]
MGEYLRLLLYRFGIPLVQQVAIDERPSVAPIRKRSVGIATGRAMQLTQHLALFESDQLCRSQRIDIAQEAS